MRTIKRISAIILAMMIVLTGIYLAPEQVQEVQAADAATTYVVIPKASTIVTKEQESGKVTSVVVNAEDATYGTYANYLFAGWLKQDAETEEYVATTEAEAEVAKFVNRDTLSVKLQIANSSVTDTEDSSIAADSAIRFISSVDSLDYSQVGFRVEGNNYPVQDNKVFNKIASTMYEAGSQKEYSFSPKVVGMDSEYFFTAKYAVASADATKDYTVQAYWTTLDGTTVYGDARKVCVADNAVTTINMPVNAKLDSNATYTATGANLTVTNVEVLTTGTACSSVRLTIDGNVMNLPSATKITFSDGTNSVAEVYRNYYTTHVVEGDSTAINADTTWYEVDKTATKFVIASSADLYGLASIINGTSTTVGQNYFKNRTVTLVRDITINEGKASSSGWSTDAPYNWTPIGKYSSSTYTGFCGTFDGDGNNISGLFVDESYDTTTTADIGLFGFAHQVSSIKNIRIKNSYFSVNNGENMGSIVGRYVGSTIENVYTDAILVATGTSMNIGNVVGSWVASTTSDSSVSTFNLKNSWSDGEIYVSGNTVNVGGFIGQVVMKLDTLNVNDCMHTGKLYSTTTTSDIGNGWIYLAGFCGIAGSTGATYNFTNYVDAGKIEANCTKMVSVLFGRVNNATGSSVVNVHILPDVTLGNSAYNSYICNWDNTTTLKSVKATNLATISSKTEEELFSSDVWMTNEGALPVLEQFVDILEDQQN